MEKIKYSVLKDMLLGAANNLINNKDYVDKLNVFPVPDGDTGTNMSLTLKSAIEEIENQKINNMKELAGALTRGSLMGARGNSGVILSQILRGFSKYIETKEELSIYDFAMALDSAKKVAYKAVIKPVEGTILTVIRETATFALDVYGNYDNFDVFFDDLIKKANESLKNTPNLLKELKEANVVDSGGQGLYFFLEGLVKTYKGEKLEKVTSEENSNSEKLFEEDIHILDKMPEFGYCTEFMLKTNKITPNQLKEEIENLGNSLIVVGADDIIKVHIHSNDPGKVFSIAGSYGELDRMKIENMRLEFKERLEENKREREKVSKFFENKKKFAIIAVSPGEGLSNIMRDSGVDYIISGGQTMNPSTSDFLEIIEKIDRDDIFIFPNNSNIFLAANQAAEISEKNVKVIPSKTIPECLEALLNMNTIESFQENEESMKEALKEVKSGQITFAVRDTFSNNLEIKKDDIIGITNKEIVSANKDINITTKELIEKMIDEDDEIISLFYGADVKEEDAQKFKDKLTDEFPDFEIELYEGSQPIYYYIVSVE